MDCIQSLVGPDLFFFEINPDEIFMAACQVISTNGLIAQLCSQRAPVLADAHVASGLSWFLLAEMVSDSVAFKVLVEMSLNNYVLFSGATHPIALPYIRREEGRKEIKSLLEPSLRCYCIHVRLFSAQVLLCLNWTSWNQLCLGSNSPQNQSIPQVLSGA